jgi:hypothetical protein
MTDELILKNKEGKVASVLKHYMNKYGGMKIKSQEFLTSVLHGSEQLPSRCTCFTCGIHQAGGWVDPTPDLNVVAKRKINNPA